MRPIPVPPDRVRTKLLLALLIVISAVLAWSAPGAAIGPFLFQSSPPGSPTPASGFDSSPLPTPTEMPGPVATPGQTPARVTPSFLPTSSNYLPPPTLTSPGILPPVIQPRLPVQPAPDEDTSLEGGGRDRRSPVAALIDNTLIALSYIWLSCGGITLVGATVALVWLLRRTSNR